MLKIPADQTELTTAEAQAMKLTATKIRATADERNNPEASVAIAEDLDAAANAHLTLEHVPMRGIGGEFIETRVKAAPALCPPRKDITRVNTDASLDRLDLINKNGVLTMALDVAESLGANSSEEQMLAHQIAAAHSMGFDLLAEAGNTRDTVEKCRLANTAVRLMDISQKAMLTLNKIRNKGQQTVTVQHVQVSDGGQAVINGSVNATGRGAHAK